MRDYPSFYIELERIRAELTYCVMPVHPFVEIHGFVPLILENPRYAKELAESTVRKGGVYRRLVEMGMDIVIAPVLLSRVLSFEIVPDFSVYVCDVGGKGEVEKTVEKMAKLEKRAIKRRDLKCRLKISELEGGMLGYPKCCISNFVRLKGESAIGRSIPPETFTILNCLKSGLFEELLRFFSNPPKELPQEFFAFFTSNFYPCDVNCSKAIDIGMRVYECLDSVKQKIYRCKLILNVLNLLASAYKSYEFVRRRGAKTEFGREISEFFGNLSADDLSRIDRISKLISANQLEFENRYISMKLD